MNRWDAAQNAAEEAAPETSQLAPSSAAQVCANVLLRDQLQHVIRG